MDTSPRVSRTHLSEKKREKEEEKERKRVYSPNPLQYIQRRENATHSHT
jgi:hypothetical protein